MPQKKKRSRPGTGSTQWSVTRSGVRFAVVRRRNKLKGPDGKPRTFRTRNAAARVARQLNRRKR